jgi:hypothetical protein
MRVRRSRNRFRFPRFEGAQLVADLHELAFLARRPPPISESERRADEAELACYLGPPLAPAELRAAPRPRPDDGRSRRATFKQWLRQHTPLVHLGLYGVGDQLSTAAEHRRRRELDEFARVRRDALAYCIDCRNPLLATEYGFQFCLYERAGQHAKVSRARNPHQVMAGRARARDAPRDTAGRFAPKGKLRVLSR